jgi:hypothetical protein
MPAKPIRPIRIEGNIAYVPLTRGYEAVIDAADVPLVSDWNWFAKADNEKRVYGVRSSRCVLGKAVLMHRIIAQCPDGLYVDHIDGNGLNNRRSNLRHATNSQNQHNQSVNSVNKSGFKGVSWHKKRGMWQARIRANKKRIWLGNYICVKEAHAAYCEASARLHGEFSRVE